ncbi:MAG: hypothetical protein IH827_08185 [Myxococcales bacterium]|nr:hypothetical protein [Myxococcales bacterium]
MNSSPPPLPVVLRGFVDGNDLAVSPFVGGTLELMTPALPIPTRPRLFLSGEILPTFASDRDLALEGDPDCVRGPEPGAVCAKNEPIDEDGNPVRLTPFGEDSTRGQGSRTSAQIDTLVFGASLGVAFPLKVGKRQLRIKPSVGWIHYKVETNGLVVDAACDTFDTPMGPENRCTDVTLVPGDPPEPGFLRETILADSASQRFNGIGPGLDIEMDTGQFGPLGVSLFMGGRAYAILGDRTISFGTTVTLPEIRDEAGEIIYEEAAASGRFEAKVDPWIFRAHVGIRFRWLGSGD